ncbi:peroxisomal N(1)-acetyl-spermine/spermidine oxidase-like isoform X2 [Eleginops maclovinus]|uniref:peroxisomal N(1)-acetyl-spermine/spermidine oxidase-like isoform X2 n=1 Tax=Eleginops maclovinus TaxID=56733 RepID=UPI003080DA82
MAMSVNAKVVIVGCGISGIAAAHRLVDAGFHHVQIVEATARSGGRIKTGKLGDNIIEIGANWIHGPSEENPVFCLARQYGLLDPEALTPENQEMDVEGHPPWVPNFFSSSGSKLNAEDIYPAQDMFLELMSEISQFKSEGEEPWACVGDFIRSEAEQRAAEKWKDIDAATRCLRLCVISNMLKVECCVNGAHSMDEVGLGAYGLYKTLPGMDCTFPGGYEGLVKNLMLELPSGLVTYNRPVRCVHWNNTEKKENSDGMLDQVPDVQRSWIKKLFGFTVLKPTERYGHILCGWIAGHESEYMETLSEQEVTHTVTQLIRRFTGNPTITPRKVLRSQWFHDPWTCGSYSYPGIGCSAQDLENMMEPLPTKGSLLQPLQVLFAGEATHPCYYSTVHGALLTGWREADRLISHYSSISASEPRKAKL